MGLSVTVKLAGGLPKKTTHSQSLGMCNGHMSAAFGQTEESKKRMQRTVQSGKASSRRARLLLRRSSKDLNYFHASGVRLVSSHDQKSLKSLHRMSQWQVRKHFRYAAKFKSEVSQASFAKWDGPQVQTLVKATKVGVISLMLK